MPHTTILHNTRILRSESERKSPRLPIYARWPCLNNQVGITQVDCPLGRAFLTGALDKANLAANDFRKNLPRFTGAAEAANQVMVDGLSRFAKAKGMTNAQVALAWLLCKHHHVVPIPGTRRINYLEQNRASADMLLSASEIAELDSLFPPDAVAGERYPEAGRVGIE